MPRPRGVYVESGTPEEGDRYLRPLMVSMRFWLAWKICVVVALLNLLLHVGEHQPTLSLYSHTPPVKVQEAVALQAVVETGRSSNHSAYLELDVRDLGVDDGTQMALLALDSRQHGYVRGGLRIWRRLLRSHVSMLFSVTIT